MGPVARKVSQKGLCGTEFKCQLGPETYIRACI